MGDIKDVYLKKPWLKFYPEKAPAKVEIPLKSLPQAFDEAAERWKDKVALIFYGEKMRYQHLQDHVNRFATALHHLGIKKGSKVALFLLNSPQFIIAYFGALKLGAIVTPISPVYVSPEVKYQIENSETQTIICQDILYDVVERAKVKLDNVILTNINEYLSAAQRFLGKSVLRDVYKKMETPSVKIFTRKGFYQFKELIEKYPPKPPQVEINPEEDLALLPYTAGTTARPKGVMLTHYNMVSADYVSQPFWPFEDGEEVAIAYMPFYHIGGQVEVMMRALLRGCTMVLFTTPDPDDIISAIQKYKSSLFLSAPTMFEVLRNHEKTSRVNWKSFKYIVSGADTLLQDTADGWERRTGVKLVEGWGMTETAAQGIHVPAKGKIKVGSFGIPQPNFTAAIVDPDTDEFLPLGEVGELIIKGPSLAKGYWKDPQETEQAFIKIDGEVWLRTGDLVRMDEDGYFWYYDRKRDRIKYKGYRISAREIEEVISSHPKVKEVGVIGVPDPMVGEQIKVVVVTQVEARGRLSEAEIMKWCEERLAHYKVPKIVEFRGEIPKTDVGKVSRREIREE